MPTITDAQPDRPAVSRPCSTAEARSRAADGSARPRSSSPIRTRSSAARCTPRRCIRRQGLARIGCAVLRFNFRGVGLSAGAFDEGEGEKDDFTAALDYMAARFPGLRLWAAGFSFGAWVALRSGAADDRVSALIGVAPPVATSVSGQEYDFTARSRARSRSSSSRARPTSLSRSGDVEFYAGCRSPRNWSSIDAPNHLFDGQTPEVGDALEDLLGDFMEGAPRVCGRRRARATPRSRVTRT